MESEDGVAWDALEGLTEDFPIVSEESSGSSDLDCSLDFLDFLATAVFDFFPESESESESDDESEDDPEELDGGSGTAAAFAASSSESELESESELLELESESELLSELLSDEESLVELAFFVFAFLERRFSSSELESLLDSDEPDEGAFLLRVFAGVGAGASSMSSSLESLSLLLLLSELSSELELEESELESLESLELDESELDSLSDELVSEEGAETGALFFPFAAVLALDFAVPPVISSQVLKRVTSDGWCAVASAACQPLPARSFLNSAWASAREYSARKASTISSTWGGGASTVGLGGADVAPFDFRDLGFSDFFAMVGAESLAFEALADELLAKSQDGGPVCCADRRLGSQQVRVCNATA